MAVNGEEVNRKAKRIVKILKQIAENLKQDEIIALRSKIKEAIEFAQKDQRDEAMIKQALGPHVQMLEFRAGISVNLLKQSVRAFLMITENEQLGKNVYELFTDYVVEEHPTVTIGLDLDDELLKVYFKALEKGSELAGHIRLMVVGMYGVGKTTLVNRLLEIDRKQIPVSTVGIDISVNACEVDENKKWKITDFEVKDKRYDLRLQELLLKNRQRQNTSPNEDEGRQVTRGQTVVREAGINQPVSTERHEHHKNTSSKNVKIDTPEIDHTEHMKKIQSELKMNNQATNKLYEHIKTADEKVKREEKINSKPITVSIWDFAGQSVYYSTHHFFLNPRAIYLVVLDLSKPLDKLVDEGGNSKGFDNLNLGSAMDAHFTQRDAFQFWLKSIYIYTRKKRSTEAPNEADYKPTIVLIGTHKDVVRREEKQPENHMESYFSEALKSFRGHPIMNLIYPQKFFVSEDESPVVFASLRSKIYEIADKQPFFREKVPAKFIPLEREVEKKKDEIKSEKKAETMNFEELENVSKGSHYPLSRNEIRLFLRFQHAFGNILHYDKANPNTIILRPQWIIDAFKLFVTHKNSHISKEWTDLKSFGKLSENLVNNMLKADSKWSPFKDEIIRYLEHLDIIAKPVKQETSQNVAPGSNTGDRWLVSIPNTESKENENFYFMPCMLPSRPSSEEIKNMFGENGKSSPILCMFIKGVMLPPSVFHRILATCIKEMEVMMFNDAYVLYSSLGAFYIDSTTVLTIWTWDNMIYFKITSYHSNKEARISKADLVQIRIHFERLVKRLFDTVGSENDENMEGNIEVSFYVTCPECQEQFPFDRDKNKDGSPIDQKCKLFLVDHKDPWPEGGILCNPNRHHIKGQDVLTHWFHDKQLPGLENADDRLLSDYEETFLENFFADLAFEIDSKKIYELATSLNISDTEHHRIMHNYEKHVLNYIFHLFYEGSKSCQSMSFIQNAAEKAGCKKDIFSQLLKGRLSDNKEKEINELVTAYSPEKMERTNLEGICGVQLARYIGEEYWLLGIRLGISEHELQRRFCGKSCEEKDILNIFIKWRRECEKTNEEALYELVRAMVKCNCNMRPITKVLKKP